MHFAELTDVEQRVLGCLIEKRWTTPDQYPLSLNALRLACNQSTNRDPVSDYGENEVRDAAQRLSRYGLARLASGAGSRATKYRHLAEEGLGLDREQLAVLCVLLLRGPQTPGELKARSERMAHLPTLADVERVLGELGEHGYAMRLERRPGQKEDRFAQLLGGAGGSGAEPDAGWRAAQAPEADWHGAAEPEPGWPAAEAPAPSAWPASPEPAAAPDLAAGVRPEAPAGRDGELEELTARVEKLEAQVAELRAQLDEVL
ncbi:MAG: YceH family protein [Solirubrobacteraceae bacterium]